MRTIRRQLLVGLLCAIVACVAGAGAMLYRSLLKETNELADLQLRQLAVALPSEFTPSLAHPGANDPEEAFVLQSWDNDGTLQHLISSPGLGRLPRYAVSGYADVALNGMRWRVYGLARPGRYVQVAQPMSARDGLAGRMALRAGMPLLAFAAVFAALMLLVVSRALRPLDRLARSVGGQSPTSLQPLDPGHMPPELRPVVLALNSLMGKFGQAMAAQRSFVADAAHELRSPLTALKLQLQLVERADSDTARAQALEKLHERLDRGSHLVQQLLSLARHESALSAAQLQPVDLGELLVSAVADHSALADSRDIDLGVEVSASVVVQADRDGLRVLLNNLVDNALRYTQRGGRVDLQSTVEDGRALLRVRDNGPGVAPGHRERLFDRFFRPDGNEVWGCGLGLSIVRNIADHHRAEVRLEQADHGRGLSVTVLFP
ncbi:ATP-binding protein [Duganella sp. Dugasp56]|uniref:ATP-binding protein n=1 Tax=Duganella sp. Dugasp56 TaxID=3243046 RepID=UPI0039AF4CBD